MTDPSKPPTDEKKDYMTDILENNVNNSEFDISNFITIKYKQRAKNTKIIDAVKDNYLKKREEIMKRNKRNLIAQKLLLEKIKEADKFQKTKRPSKFIPFFNLQFKHKEEDDLRKSREKMLLDKYYKKNSIKPFMVRLKSKNSTSFVNNNSNNSLNSSMNDIMDQYNQFRSFLQHDNKEESININTNNIDNPNSNNNSDIKSGSEENNDIFKYINEETNSNNLLNNKDKNTENDIEKINNRHTNDNKIEDKNHFVVLNNKNYKIFSKRINKKNEKKNDNSEEKISEYIRLYLEKYKKNYENEKILNEESEEDIDLKFSIIIKENEELIRKSNRKEEMELFLEFKEKINSLEKFSKKEFNLYIIRNYKILLKILEECKRDTEKEMRINEYLKALNNDLDKLYQYKNMILNDIKIVDYQPFIPYLLQK